MSLVPILGGVVIGVPVLLVGGLTIAGLFAPKSHTATRSVTYAAPREAVWTLVIDWPGRPSWRPKLRAVERLPDRNGHAVWKETRGRGDALASEVVELDPARMRMVTRIADETAFGGTWTWQVEPAGTGSRLSITEDGEIYNPIFRAIAAFFFDMRRTMDGVQRDLKARLGEPPPDLPD